MSNLPELLPLAPLRFEPQHIAFFLTKIIMSNIYTSEFELNIQSGYVGENRKLKATWSREAVQDLQAFYNIDAEEELTKILAKEIAAEIDKAVIEDLIQAQTANEMQQKLRKKKIMARSIDEDWEVSRID